MTGGCSGSRCIHGRSPDKLDLARLAFYWAVRTAAPQPLRDPPQRTETGSTACDPIANSLGCWRILPDGPDYGLLT
jgi:hypothetical protein